jgi:hypothetical protein
MTDEVQYTRRGFFQKSAAVGAAAGAGLMVGSDHLAQTETQNAHETHKNAIAAITDEATKQALSPEEIVNRYLDHMKGVDKSRIKTARFETRPRTAGDNVGVAIGAGGMGLVGAMLGGLVGDERGYKKARRQTLKDKADGQNSGQGRG